MLKPALCAAAASIVLLIGLTGCGAATVEADGVGQGSSAPSEAPRAEPSSVPTAAVIEMEAAPDIDPATPWGESGFESADAWYLASMGSTWQGEQPADEQLIGAGMLACQELAQGVALDTIVVVTGDTPDAVLNNSRTVNYAQMALCP